MDWSLLGPLEPLVPWLIGVLVLTVVISAPMPGRGSISARHRDPWRRFKDGARREVMERAANRCESGLFLAWGRCPDTAEEVDHIFPWSKGGATVPSNGQALCKGHNRSKSNMSPPWWYIVRLERRRRSYFPAGQDVRVFAAMSLVDSEARAPSSKR